MFMMKKKKKMAGGGEVKGVHKDRSRFFGHSAEGQSLAGEVIRSKGNSEYSSESPSERNQIEENKIKEQRAKDIHKQKLEELKSMPNPKLKGLADGGSVWDRAGKAASNQVSPSGAQQIANAFKAEGGMMEDEHEDIVSRIMAKRKKAKEDPMSREDDIMNTADMDEENVAHEMEGLHQNEEGGADYGDEEGDDDFVARIMKKNKEKKAKFLGK